MHILIIGNGFDIAHGLKTSYKDFLEYCKEINAHSADDVDQATLKCCKTNLWMKHFITKQAELGNTWVDLENEIFNVIIQLNNIPPIKGSGTDSQLLPLYLYCPQNCSTFKFSNIMNYLTKSQPIQIAKPNLLRINTLEEFTSFLYIQLREFVKIFENYLLTKELQNLSENSKYLLSLNDKPTEQQIFDLSVLSFNYTNTCEKLYKGIYNSSGGKNYQISTYYVHGKANSSNDCNLVLGTQSFSNNTITNSLGKSLPINFNIFQKHNQRHKYGTIEEYQTLLKIIKNDNNPVFHIIGHSLDKTDHNILKHILLMNQNAQIKIYYHDELSQEKLINNITSIIGEEEVMSKVLLIHQHDKDRGLLK